MREIVRFTRAEAQPPLASVLEAQGLPAEDALAPRLRRLIDEAMASYASLIEPRAAVEDVTAAAFATVLAPVGIAEEHLAVGRVYARAEALALFVATLGEALPDRIRKLFSEDALAEGYMLDSVASAGADLLSSRLAERFEMRLAAEGKAGVRALPYSPGYCGWPTAGQEPLFAVLRPREIGVTLNASCLMTPIKSVSGVLVAGAGEVHRFRPDFPFCDDCETRDCSRRLASVLKPH